MRAEPTGYGFIVHWGEASRHSDAGDVTAVVTRDCLSGETLCFRCSRRGVDWCEHVRVVTDYCDPRG